MVFSARPDKNLPRADTNGLVDMRTGAPVLGGTFVYDGDDLVTPWHFHDLHEIEYAMWGAVEVETEWGRYLLPPQQAAWLPAGLSHRSTIRTAVRSISVLLHPALVAEPGDRARILAVPPVIKEMMAFAVRWPITRVESDHLADRYFEVFAQLVADALDHEAPFILPTSKHPIVGAAMDFTRDHLEDVTVDQVASEVSVCERTLRRLFEANAGMSWRRYLLQARLLRAVALLAEPRRTVIDVSTEVGFENVSSFTRAFVRQTGETPSAYRRRVRSSLPL